MIQRIQSLLLLIMALLMVAFLFSPIWQNENKKEIKDGQTIDKTSDIKVTLTAFVLTLSGTEKVEERTELNIVKEQKMISETKSAVYIGILAIGVAAAAAYSIFQYRNRLLQIKLGALNSLVLCLIIVCIYINIVQGNKLLNVPAEGNFQIGFFLPVGAIVLNLFSNWFIRKDEKLVKSADRIR